MFKIAYRFAIGKRKQSLWLWVIIVFSMALILSIVPLFDAARDNIFQMYANKYGEHHGIVWEVNDNRIQGFREYLPVKRVGVITNYGVWKIDDGGHRLTLGNMDEIALDMGHVRLLKGEMPKNAQEIAIEKTLCLMFEQKIELGTTVQLHQGDVTKEFTVVGILADYASQWDMGSASAPGKRDIPGALTGTEGMEDYQTNIGAMIQGDLPSLTFLEEWRRLVYGQGVPKDSSDSNIYIDKWGDRYHLHDGVINNYIFYGQIQDFVLKPFDDFKHIFTIVIILGSCLTIYSAIIVYIQNCKESYQKLYHIGASNLQTLTIFLLQCGCLILSALPFSLLAALLLEWIANLIIKGTHVSIFVSGNFFYPIVVLVSIMLCMAVVFRAIIYPFAEGSLSQSKRERMPKRGYSVKYFTWYMLRSFWHSNFRRVVLITVVAGMLVASFCTAQIYIQQINTQDLTKPDLSASMLSAEGHIVSPLVIHSYAEEMIAWEGIEQLRLMPGVKALKANGHHCWVCMVLPDELDAYWQFYRNPDFENLSDNQLNATDLWGIPADINLSTRFNVLILDESNIPYYSEYMPDLPIEKMKEQGGIAMCLPERDEEGKILRNTYFKADMEVEFMRATYDPMVATFETLPNNSEYIELEKFTLPVLYVTEKSAMEESVYTEEDMSPVSGPVILITKETAEQTRLVLGADSLYMRLEADISEEEYQAVRDAFMEKALSVPGMLVVDEEEEKRQDKALINAVNASLTILLVVFGGFVLISIYAILYMTVIKKRRTLAIYRALGTARIKLTMAIWIELCSYWIILILMAILCSICLFNLLWEMQWLPTYLPAMIGVWSIAAATGIPTCAMITMLLLRNIYRNSVYEAMRFSD